ncbi:MAG: hypothetical protein QOD70_983 [Frankiales bacterium]|nr:hypothetical protein [Frankiales bacterium]
MMRRRGAQTADEGFTLIEAVVALSISAVVMAAFAVAVIGGVKAGVVARENQQAGDLLNKAVEEARATNWSLLANAAGDVSGTDGGLVSPCSGGSGTCLSVSGSQEKLLIAAGGAISPHNSTVTLNKVAFTVRKYVTVPADTEAQATYRRFTAYVQWTALGKVHSRLASTYVADTRRGLPLPYYKFTAVGPSTVGVNTGAQVVFGFKLVNNGARDSWNLTTSDATLGWSWLRDDGDGVFDSTKDTTAFTDTTGDGVIDTGTIEPTASVIIWVVRTVPSSPAAPYTKVATFTATSYAAATSSSTLSTTTNVVSGVVTPTASPTPSATASATATPTASPTASSSGCPATQPTPTPTPSGVTQTGFYLYNDATTFGAANTTAQSLMALANVAAPSSSTLHDYSTDDGITSAGITAGRMLQPSTLGTSETAALKKAQFEYRLTSAKKMIGAATVTLWATPQSGLTTDGVHLKVYLVTKSKSGSQYVATTRATSTYDATAWGCNTFNSLTLSFPGLNVSLANNDYVELYVQNTGSTNVRLEYGSTAYPSGMVIPLS